MSDREEMQEIKAFNVYLGDLDENTGEQWGEYCDRYGHQAAREYWKLRQEGMSHGDAVMKAELPQNDINNEPNALIASPDGSESFDVQEHLYGEEDRLLAGEQGSSSGEEHTTELEKETEETTEEVTVPQEALPIKGTYQTCDESEQKDYLKKAYPKSPELW